MNIAYRCDNAGMVTKGEIDARTIGDDVLWIDAVAPEDAELAELGKSLGVEIPSWAEMEEIELSSRLRRENGFLVMIANFIPKCPSRPLPTLPVTFVLQKNRLITVRRERFASFERVVKLLNTPDGTDLASPVGVLCSLLDEEVSDRADNLELVIKVMDELAMELFSLPRPASRPAPSEPQGLKDILKRIGEAGETLANVRESLASIQRALHFLKAHLPPERLGTNAGAIDSINSDINALADEAAFLMNRLAFYLDATLGMINIEENQVVKVLSAIAMIFCPPMLIAGIYGMNFVDMPELKWPWGYYLALGAIAGVILLQFWYVKKRKWF